MTAEATTSGGSLSKAYATTIEYDYDLDALYAAFEAGEIDIFNDHKRGVIISRQCGEASYYEWTSKTV
ncbi:MAG: hypothetical protein AAGJ50_03770 [Pseudomonadota bacterium]